MQAHAWPTPGLIDVGRYPSGSDAGAEDIVDAFNGAGFNCVVRDDIMRWKYAKLLLNLGNAVMALCGSGGDEAAELRRSARHEGVAVLEAAGIDYASTRRTSSAAADTLTIVPINGERRTGGSTWQSLARGTGASRPTGSTARSWRLGRRHGVATPVNAVLQRLTNQAAREGRPPESMAAAEILSHL